MPKHVIDTIAKKKRIAANIIQRLCDGEHFLMLGHADPDEDCIAAMVSFALLVAKFDKNATLFITGNLNEQFSYLIDICQYNAIHVTCDNDIDMSNIDTVVFCDTPKPEMISAPNSARQLFDDPDVIKIEFDHHIAADSAYIGDPEYALVTEASSACELIGYIGLKLNHRPDLIERYHISEVISRNLVLALLTGIIGDSKMGKFLKSRRERRFYEIFTGMFNELLVVGTWSTNRSDIFSNKEEVFDAIVRLSANEEACFTYFMKRAAVSSSVGHVILDESESKTLFDRFDTDTVVSVARSAADALAEQSSKLSLIGYFDFGKPEKLIQFRIRRSHNFKSFDVRSVLDQFQIENGGGHEGAIGFRFERETVDDIREFGAKLIAGIESVIS